MRELRFNLLGHPWLHLVFIAAVVLAVYANSLPVPFYFDDLVMIVGNPEVEHFQLSWSDPRLVGSFTFALNYALRGRWIPGYHLVNIAVHAGCALLVYVLGLALLRTGSGRGEHRSEPVRAVALVAALLFACHPVNTQAVTYIVQRFASLGALFFLASVTAWMHFRSSEQRGQRRWLWYLLSLLATLLAFKTKENTAILPLALGMVEFTFFRTRPAGTWLRLAAFLGLAAVIPLSHWVGSGEDLAAATRVYTDMSRATYAITQIAVVGTYLRLLVLPVRQNLDYDYPVYDSLMEPTILASLAIHVVLLGAAALLLGRARSARPTLTLIGFGIGWFYATLLVESSVIPIADVIYEHRVYLPSVGIFLALTSAAAESFVPSVGRRGAILAAVAVLTLSGVATVRRNAVWQSPVRLWSSVVEGSPAKARALNNLGVAHYDAGDRLAAIRWYRRAIEADHTFTKAYYNLAEAEFYEGRPREALVPLQVFVSAWPDHPLGHELLGRIYRELNDPVRAALHERTAADLRRRSEQEGLKLQYRGETVRPP